MKPKGSHVLYTHSPKARINTLIHQGSEAECEQVLERLARNNGSNSNQRIIARASARVAFGLLPAS